MDSFLLFLRCGRDPLEWPLYQFLWRAGHDVQPVAADVADGIVLLLLDVRDDAPGFELSSALQTLYALDGALASSDDAHGATRVS